MPVDAFDTAVLNRVVESLPRPTSFILDTFFPMEQREESEEIHFDIDKSKPRITPFVHPTKAGKVVPNLGFETATFKPAYAKDKRIFQPNGPLKRVIGETIGGSMSLQQRRDLALKFALQDQIEMLTRREVVMAMEALRLGQVTVAGDDYPTVVVDFKRHANLTVQLAGGARWGEAGVSPIDNLETWANSALPLSGAAMRTAVLDPLSLALLRADPKWEKMLDRESNRGDRNLPDGVVTRGTGDDSAVYIGRIGTLEIWLYSEPYVDEAGADQNMMPDYQVILGARGQNNTGKGGLEGTRCYGAILDEKAGFKAQRYFSKSWVEEDPPVRNLLLTSAPLIVPYRPNASMGIRVR